ncbi:MAG: methionine gamma-lyase family protein [Christensenellales bacterium]|nr:methionine gamma-lyase family protein [Christensenellales bacterium]
MRRESAEKIVSESLAELAPRFAVLDETALFNQEKVLNAFRKNAVQARHFIGTTGYGYDDAGRDTLCAVFADALGAESAVVSPSITAGTQALALMLFGVLRPGDLLLSVSGKPYDTLTDVISGENCGSLKEFGVDFEQIALKFEGLKPVFDFEAIEKALKRRFVKAVFVGRSRGYEWRSAVSVGQIGEMIAFVKKISPDTLVLVDNCYGEFVEKAEPTAVGADLIAGSLIKNIGGGIAPTGGYIAGRKELTELVGKRLTAPSLGMEVGSYEGGYTRFYQGLFLAPQVTKNALKGAFLFAKAYEKVGFDTLPRANMPAYDIVTSIKMNSAKQLTDFCEVIQSVSPVDSNVVPVPWAMPGYQHDVIMAAGAFVQGASIELSADAPIKEPYIVYVQGALTFEHAVIAVRETLQKVIGDDIAL